MKRLAVLAIAIAGAGACGSGGSKSSSTTTTPTDWDAGALQVADGLKAKLVAAKATCSDYTHWNYGVLTGSYKKTNLPIPAAVTTCQGEAVEDLTTEVFGDPAAKDKFIAAKKTALCAAAAKKKLDFPGFFYVDGDNWIFEPDEQATAVAMQKILGGTVKQAGCKS